MAECGPVTCPASVGVPGDGKRRLGPAHSTRWRAVLSPAAVPSGGLQGVVERGVSRRREDAELHDFTEALHGFEERSGVDTMAKNEDLVAYAVVLWLGTDQEEANRERDGSDILRPPPAPCFSVASGQRAEFA